MNARTANALSLLLYPVWWFIAGVAFVLYPVDAWLEKRNKLRRDVFADLDDAYDHGYFRYSTRYATTEEIAGDMHRCGRRCLGMPVERIAPHVEAWLTERRDVYTAEMKGHTE